MAEIVEELSCWYEPDRVRALSENRVDFSYWVASNLPLGDETKLQLLGVNCSMQRLRAELSLMKQVCRQPATILPTPLKLAVSVC